MKHGESHWSQFKKQYEVALALGNILVNFTRVMTKYLANTTYWKKRNLDQDYSSSWGEVTAVTMTPVDMPTVEMTTYRDVWLFSIIYSSTLDLHTTIKSIFFSNLSN